jgi:hypothetical protein
MWKGDENMRTEKLQYGKRKSTLICGVVTIQTFEKGLRIAKRKGGELLLDDTETSVLACHIRDFSSPRLFTEPELRVILRMAGVESYTEHIKKYDGMTYKEKWPE